MDPAASWSFPHAPKPIPIPAPAPAQVERQRQVEFLSGELGGDISWSGPSMGSWIRDDLVMTGTSPFPDQSPSCWSKSHISKIESEFLRNFTCCDIKLETHHDLAKHSEENHGGEAPISRGTLNFGQLGESHRQDCPAPAPKPAEVDGSKPFSFTGLPVLLKRERLSVENVLKLEKSTSTGFFAGASRGVKSTMDCRSVQTVDTENATMLDSGTQFITSNPMGQNDDQRVPAKPRIYSDQEWEHFKETFKRLYVVEDKPLRLVARIMKDDFGFYATEKQFKTRVAQWGLEKNVKQREMIAIVRKQQQRMIVDNKESAFRVRGRDVEANKIHRFIKRQETKNMGSIPITSPADSTPSAISCYTPRQWGPSSPNESTSPPSRPQTTPLSEISANSIHYRDSTPDAQEHPPFMPSSFSKTMTEAPRRGSMTPISSPTTTTGFHAKFSEEPAADVPGRTVGFERPTWPLLHTGFNPTAFGSNQAFETEENTRLAWQAAEYQVW